MLFRSVTGKLGYYHIDSGQTLSVTQLQAGLKYVWEPFKAWTPYFGTGLNLSLLNDIYDTPLWGISFKGGVSLKTNQVTRVFLELEKSIQYDNKQKKNMDTYFLNLGVSFNERFFFPDHRSNYNKKRHISPKLKNRRIRKYQ